MATATCAHTVFSEARRRAAGACSTTAIPAATRTPGTSWTPPTTCKQPSLLARCPHNRNGLRNSHARRRGASPSTPSPENPKR